MLATAVVDVSFATGTLEIREWPEGLAPSPGAALAAPPVMREYLERHGLQSKE